MNGNVMQIKITPEDLRLLGLSVLVELELVSNPPEATPKRFKDIVALIDTGASHSSVSRRLADRFRAAPIRSVIQFTADREPQRVPAYRCKIFYPCGVSAENNFSVLPGLAEPHDMLIGRDLLASNGVQLTVNFPSGNWSIMFSIAHGNDSA